MWPVCPTRYYANAEISEYKVIPKIACSLHCCQFEAIRWTLEDGAVLVGMTIYNVLCASDILIHSWLLGQSLVKQGSRGEALG